MSGIKPEDSLNFEEEVLNPNIQTGDLPTSTSQYSSSSRSHPGHITTTKQISSTKIETPIHQGSINEIKEEFQESSNNSQETNQDDRLRTIPQIQHRNVSTGDPVVIERGNPYNKNFEQDTDVYFEPQRGITDNQTDLHVADNQNESSMISFPIMAHIPFEVRTSGFRTFFVHHDHEGRKIFMSQVGSVPKVIFDIYMAKRIKVDCVECKSNVIFTPIDIVKQFNLEIYDFFKQNFPLRDKERFIRSIEEIKIKCDFVVSYKFLDCFRMLLLNVKSLLSDKDIQELYEYFSQKKNQALLAVTVKFLLRNYLIRDIEYVKDDNSWKANALDLSWVFSAYLLNELGIKSIIE